MNDCEKATARRAIMLIEAFINFKTIDWNVSGDDMWFRVETVSHLLRLIAIDSTKLRVRE